MTIITYIETLSEDGEEVVDSGCLQLGLDSSDSDSLLVDHLHHLPLLPVLRGTPVLGSSEVVFRVVVVLLRQVGLDNHFARIFLVLADHLKDFISDVQKVLLVDDLSEGLQNKCLDREVLLVPLFERQEPEAHLTHLGHPLGFQSYLRELPELQVLTELGHQRVNP